MKKEKGGGGRGGPEVTHEMRSPLSRRGGGETAVDVAWTRSKERRKGGRDLAFPRKKKKKVKKSVFEKKGGGCVVCIFMWGGG